MIFFLQINGIIFNFGVPAITSAMPLKTYRVNFIRCSSLLKPEMILEDMAFVAIYYRV